LKPSARSFAFLVGVFVLGAASVCIQGQQQPHVQLGPAPRITDPRQLAPTVFPPASERLVAIDPFNRQAVVDLYNSTYVPALAVVNDWNGSVGTCMPGTTSAAYADATITVVNYFRAMARLPAMLPRNPTKDAKSQRAALMMTANNALSHFPPTSWLCYSADGAEAAGRANLALGATGASAVTLFIQDAGSGNTGLGHRRWLLYPSQTEMGTGSTNNANAIWVIGDFGPRPTTPSFVTWPNAGFVPYQIVYPRWSFSVNTSSSVDFSSAVVTMSRGGEPIPLSTLPLATGFGDNTVAWEPVGIASGAGMVDQPIAVTIQNVMVGGMAANYSYTVTIIDPAVVPPVDTVDTDGDGLTDSWERQFGLSPNSAAGNDGATGDLDDDGVTNLAEFQAGTDPTLPNTVNLPEGATGFFQERIAVANPGTDTATFTVTFLPESGSPVAQTYTLPGQRRTTITVNDVPGLSNAALSAVITTTMGGVVVERTMLWNAGDGGFYGGHTGKAIPQARTTWYLAEGEASFFDTYILLANATNSAASVTLSFLLENGNTITQTRSVPANARVTVYANDVPGLRGNAFSTTITSNIPITVERAMYFGSNVRLFNGGHGAAAVAAPATSWFVAEGRTGPFFDMYLLLANPGSVAANATITFLLPNGSTVVQNRLLNPTSRTTIHVDSVPNLADTDVSASITSDQPIIVERAMYWPDPFTNWYEAHNSAGVTATGTKWALAEGEVGGALGFETYILLANPSSAAATVTLTFLGASGSPLTLTRNVPAKGRLTVSAAEAALSSGEQFGVLIDATQPIAVERAMYWNGGGQFWGAGTNETAVRIR
jgi:uncharacterized protein YkwD